MKRRQIIILSAIALILIWIIAMFVTKKKDPVEKKDVALSSVKYVKTEAVKNGNYPLNIKASGRVGSSRNLMIIAEVQGKLLPGEVKLKSGASFSSGQLLFTIDDLEVRLKMQARKSGFMTLIAAALPDLKIDYPEAFASWEAFFEKIDVAKPLPDLPEIKSVKGKTYLASRNILTEYYSIKADEKMLEKYKIYAPFSGSFVDVFTEQGSVVNPGSQIARIIESANLEVNVPVPVEDVAFLKTGDVVTVFLSASENPVEGRILRIGRYVNPNTQSIDVFVGLSEKDAATIYDGMYLEAEIKAGELSDVVRVPRKALITGEEIYTVDDTILVRQHVQVVARDDEFAYLRGVDEGANVVIEALSNATDSMVVKMIPHDE